MSLEFEKYDQRKYPTVPVVDGYTEWSESYDQTVFTEMSIDLLERISCIHWASTEKVLDLACGTGLVGRWLKSRGVRHVTGLDLTPSMLEVARAKGVYDDLRIVDMRDTGLEAGRFEVVTNSLADEHLPDLFPLYQEAFRVTKDWGYYVTVGYHPFFLLTGVPTHFDRADGQSISIKNYIHMFSDHFAAATRAGWRLRELHERVVDEKWVAQKPSWQKHVGKPISFLLAWQK
ncbi:MAG: class I SAM-dependent methyltransferase [Bdellovibrionales bacterium]